MTAGDTILDTLLLGHLHEQAVPNDAELRAMAAHAGTDVEAVKDAFAKKWREAGNLDDPFGRNPPEDEDD